MAPDSKLQTMSGLDIAVAVPARRKRTQTVYSGRKWAFQPALESLGQLVRLRRLFAPRPASIGGEVPRMRAPPRGGERQVSEIDRMRDPLTPADVAGALAGDEDSLNRLVENLTPVIQSRVAAILWRRSRVVASAIRQQVEDLVQEVFIALFDKRGATLQSWDPARGTSLESFVGMVAERRAISFLRSGRKNPWKEESALPEELDGIGSEVGSENLIAARELLREILRRLEAELSPLGWKIFRLLFVEERSVAEIGREADLSADAIYAWRSRLRRQARRLRLEIEPPQDSESRRSPSRQKHV